MSHHTARSIRPIGHRRDGSPVWPIAGGSDADSGDADTPAQGDPSASNGEAGDDGDKGFPANTPVDEMAAEQQAAYWRYCTRRHEVRAAARADYDQLKAAADELAEMKRQNMTPDEQALDAARAEGRAEAHRVAAAQGVAVHFEAAVNVGRLDEETARALLDSVNPDKLTTDGRVDADKVKTLLDRIAPATGSNTPPLSGTSFPDLGQGQRDPAKPNGKALGSAEAARRFGAPVGP